MKAKMNFMKNLKQSLLFLRHSLKIVKQHLNSLTMKLKFDAINIFKNTSIDKNSPKMYLYVIYLEISTYLFV